ncbi:MAG: dienelactone hydrolase family protein [Burkholderiales bacterium]|nr:dienelactone hydrolase family protein [Burkholderiales bacterium]
MRLPRWLAAVAALLLAACGSMDVNFRNVDWPGAGYPSRQVTAVLTKPEGEGPFPAVVLLHTCSGLQAPLTREWPEYFVSLGYVTLAVDTFGSRGLGPCPNGLHAGGRPAMSDAYSEMTRDAYGALEYLAALPFVKGDRVAVVGFALGGEAIDSFLILQPQRPRDFAAALSVYQRSDEANRLPALRIPLAQVAGGEPRERVRAFLARHLQ